MSETQAIFYFEPDDSVYRRADSPCCAAQRRSELEVMRSDRLAACIVANHPSRHIGGS